MSRYRIYIKYDRIQNVAIIIVITKGKGQPRTDHEVPEGE